tara:strand:+ start:2805 stop:5459 length:2655 start_codon:yes stop_codon:yes gene_type:complete
LINNNISNEELVTASTIVAPSSVLAKQTSIYLARNSLNVDSTAWDAPSVVSYQGWVRDLYALSEMKVTRQLINSSQARVIWQNIIERSSISHRLIGTSNVVNWAINASELLHKWALDLKDLEPWSKNREVNQFIKWKTQYELRLKDEGWIDAANAEIAIRNGITHKTDSIIRTIWAEIDANPSQALLLKELNKKTVNIKNWSPIDRKINCSRIMFHDEIEEITTAAIWAKEKIEADPKERLALVIPSLTSKYKEIYQLLNSILGSDNEQLGTDGYGFYDFRTNTNEIDPTVGSALTVLSLFSREGNFYDFSRLLRNPLFSSDTICLARRGIIEANLRRSIQTQLRFLDAFQGGGLSDYLRKEDPKLEQALQKCIKRIPPVNTSLVPSQWVDIWVDLLQILGWQAQTLQTPGASCWESALNEFAQLTVVIGPISISRAINELTNILVNKRTNEALPINGIFLFQNLDSVGYGYTNIWATGLTDNRWPMAANPNPLIPLQLQRDLNMPLATPKQALSQSIDSINRLLRLSPQVTFSWHETSDELQVGPSSLIMTYPETTNSKLKSSSVFDICDKLDTNEIEVITDKPPALVGDLIKGGTKLLDIQSECPLRAFFDGRLGTNSLEEITIGVSPKNHGIAVHRAMHLLMQDKPCKPDVRKWTVEERDKNISAAISLALEEMFGKTSSYLRTIYSLQTKRMNLILNRAFETEIKRSVFDVSELEQERVHKILGFKVTYKMDRIDKLHMPDGTKINVIIDYKTGNRSSLKWFNKRLGDVQLPLYVLCSADKTAGIIIATLAPDTVVYDGYWEPQELFPGRPKVLPLERSWDDQLIIWKDQIETLVDEYIQGDSRIFSESIKLAERDYAPLTRVYEQLKINRVKEKDLNGK